MKWPSIRWQIRETFGKRVAFAVTDVFLRINGYRITADSQAIFAALMKLFADQTFDVEHLRPWLESIVEQEPET